MLIFPYSPTWPLEQGILFTNFITLFAHSYRLVSSYIFILVFSSKFFFFSKLIIINSFKVVQMFLPFRSPLYVPPHNDLIMCYNLHLALSYLFYSVVIYVSGTILLYLVLRWLWPWSCSMCLKKFSWKKS